MREKEIETALVKAVKARGGICPKWASPGFDGMPDRIVLLPGGHIGFAELKAPGEKPRPLQLSRHRLLRRLGFKVYVIDGKAQIPAVIDEVGGDNGFDKA
ncbi:VRR-NUC domain-containing protein [uncultured Dysosmobacter sp.]|uniref:VRR-NUC domain-containing protein n=1 Tax=uncultured Dysosmobacter sp. TaxID=2591384 RepID=UPI00262DC42B|nr:VRR-NUC domain-containing protein [uncultured Dysosmobacter sp.]